LIPIPMGVSVIHVVLAFRRRESECLWGFDAEIVQVRSLIDAGAVGIERQSASLESTLSVPAVLT
jgi:hypothetical protein